MVAETRHICKLYGERRLRKRGDVISYGAQAAARNGTKTGSTGEEMATSHASR